MQRKTLAILEYDKICAKLASHTVSTMGRELALALLPSTDRGETHTLLEQTEEAQNVLLTSGKNPIEGFADMRSCIKRMHAALYLSTGELLQLSQCLRASRLAKECLEQQKDIPALQYMAVRLATHRYIEEEIARTIIAQDEIADAASPALARIRRQIRLTNENVRAKLNDMIRSVTFQKYLQEPIITIRGGRFVLPVRQEYRQYVPGVVHDQSASGATLYIEPMSVVEMDNEYKRLLIQEEEEIERILMELTAMVQPCAEELYESLELLAQLDLIFAKATLAKELRGVRPKLSEDGAIHIIKGRHPLLAKNTVVPIEIWLGEQFRTLIITGPNTGGKTVTLKTVGLFVLMTQAGLFVPAEEGTVMGVYRRVCADIGDEQSIEQSLSTFSSHMTNIVTILQKADENTLVLLDELGAGTDPVEGAALAMSILEQLHSWRCKTIATTHYSEIKGFAMMREGMENASMEFDVEKLCPTYRLFIGIPGKSNAFEISSRLGLSDAVIDRARELLKQEDVKMEDLLQNVEQQRALVEREYEQAQQARQEADRLQEQLRSEQERLQNETTKVKTKAREDARKLVQGTRQEMEEVILQLRSLKNVDQRELDRAIQQARDRARRAEDRLAEKLQWKREAGEPPREVKAGDEVYVVSIAQNAVVLKAPDARDEIQVQVGPMKMMVARKDVRPQEKKQPARPQHSGTVSIQNQEVPLELDIRGKLVDEAIVEIDRYVDTAYMAGRKEIRIIHGKGTGALRAGVQDYLKRHPRVKSFRLGAYGEGDAGVTVATLK